MWDTGLKLSNINHANTCSLFPLMAVSYPVSIYRAQSSVALFSQSS